MKTTINLFCSLLLVTSFYFCKASSDDETIKRLKAAGVTLIITPYKPRELPQYPELPGEIELITGATVPKKYESIIRKLFGHNGYCKPGHCIFPVLRALKEKYESNNNQFTALENYDPESYALHPEKNAPHAYNILNAIFNTYPSLRLDPTQHIKPEDLIPGYSQDFTSENWYSLGISFPFKYPKQD